MIKSEAELKKQSVYTGLVGLAVFACLAFISHHISWLLGYGLGFGVSLAILALDCATTQSLLSLRISKTGFLQAFLFILKMGIYALGFLVAVLIPGLINIYCVAIGYLTVKMTIFRLAMTRR